MLATKVERAKLAARCLELITEPSVLLVDPCAVAGFDDSLWLLFEQKQNIFNILSLADYAGLFNEHAEAAGMLCLDADENLKQIVILLTSQTGEDLYAKFEQARQAAMAHHHPLRVQVIREAIYGLVPAKLASGLFFALAQEPCFAPTPHLFHVRDKRNAFELDLQEQVPGGYRAKLKRIAIGLANAIANQLEWDVSDQVFSVGFGASLLANTICRMNLAKNSSNKASLLIMDRTVDWASAFDSKQVSDATTIHLHNQLLAAHQSGEVLPHITGLLHKKLCSPAQALAYAVRATSAFGEEFDLSGVHDFVRALGVPLSSDSVAQFLSEIAHARRDCFEEEEEQHAYHSLPCDALLPGAILQAMEHAKFPGCVKHANPNPFNVFSLLGSVSTSNGSSSAEEFQSRARVVIFVLGGATRQDYALLEEACMVAAGQPIEFCLIGSSLFDSNEELGANLLEMLLAQRHAVGPEEEKELDRPSRAGISRYQPPAVSNQFAKLFS